MPVTKTELLESLCREVLTDPLLMAETLSDGTVVTYCNVAVKRIANKLGCDFKAVMANDMIDEMANRPDFVKGCGKEAQEHAALGNLAIAGHKYFKHGHVAVIYPSTDLYLSPSTNTLVPYVANVGKQNGVMAVSTVFTVFTRDSNGHKEILEDWEPTYFLWHTV